MELYKDAFWGFRLTQTSPTAFTGEEDWVDTVKSCTDNRVTLNSALVAVAHLTSVIGWDPLGVLFSHLS
jgi:hypothetical protein